ncbi:MAG: hypothetical protein HS117_23530 [Verrucomicrobiaceae bacterium]|jgi:hypothetical protein|nr:hypothetical protein [Verrucomicrobiaceae bacterium]
MKTLGPHRWLTWLLGIWEGLLFGWFVFLVHFMTGQMIQVAEAVWNPEPPDGLPAATAWVMAAWPESVWARLAGVLGAGMGFGLLSSISSESFTSRVFRWVLILSTTCIAFVSIPIMERSKILSGGPEGRLWDEILFFCLGIILFIVALCRFWRRPS